MVGYDPAADAYTVLDCTAPANAHECNHTLGWSAAGAVARLVPAAELELDRTFTTKDACEELVKPLVVPYGLSVVGLLQRAAADPGIRAALSDPAQAGLVAPGLRHLFEGPASASITMAMVALASVFDSQAGSRVRKRLYSHAMGFFLRQLDGDGGAHTPSQRTVHVHGSEPGWNGFQAGWYIHTTIMDGDIQPARWWYSSWMVCHCAQTAPTSE